MALKRLTYAGHSAVFCEAPDYVIAIDPWLQGNPSCPEQLANPKRVDLIILTHGHSDHTSDAVRLAKHYGAQVLATWELAMIMGKEGVPEKNLIPMNKGGSLTIPGFRITLTHALHSSSYDTDQGPVYAGEACGVVIDDGHTPVYHAGDTALFSDMRLIGEYHRPHVAFLPIGDRFTMNPEQAAHAAALIDCEIAIPIHYATFGILTGSAADFKVACKQRNVEALALEPGESYSIE